MVSDPSGPPYAGAVSNNVMPASNAARTTSLVCSCPQRTPKLLPPNPMAETVRPEVPSWRKRTARSVHPGGAQVESTTRALANDAVHLVGRDRHLQQRAQRHGEAIVEDEVVD